MSYNILPKTENRSLEDIEKHFADSRKKWTDTNIASSDHIEFQKQKCSR